MSPSIQQTQELEAFCSTCPAPEEVTAFLRTLGFTLDFHMPAVIPSACSAVALLPAQYHYQRPDGMSLIYLAGADSATEDGVRLPAHQSRFWAYSGSDAAAFGWITRRVARQWSFTWRPASSSQVHTCTDVA
jgi:hypothetical protein